MDAVTRAQIIWAETKDLRLPDGGDPATLATLRRQITAIANEDARGFARFEPLPARDDGAVGDEVADCAAAAEASVSDPAMKGRRVIVWPSVDGRTPGAGEVPLPPPWDAAAPGSSTPIGRFTVGGRQVAAFSRPLAPGEDGVRFASLVTGTGLAPSAAAFVLRAGAPPRVASRTARRTAVWLSVAALVLFAVACLWSLSVGRLTHAAQASFAAALPDGDPCPTGVVAGDASTLFGAPRAWLPTVPGPGSCPAMWRNATVEALSTDGRDWWAQATARLARLSLSDASHAFSLRAPILAMMAAIVCVAVAAGLGVLGRPLGLFVDDRNRLSLTRIQFTVWLIVLIGGLSSYGLFNVGFWAGDLGRIADGLAYVAAAGQTDWALAGWAGKLNGLQEFLPAMDNALKALIGISGGTAVASRLLTSRAGTAGPPSATVMPPRRVRVLVNASPDDAALSDLVYGETEADAGIVDSTRVQTIAITGVLVAVYVSLVLETADRIGGLSAEDAVANGRQVFASLPPVGSTFLWLLGLSHATLLGGKLMGAYGAPSSPGG